MKPMLSVIVPVYNVEKYLGANLDSLLNQTYENIEIIAVNDGSKDSSFDILKNYQKKYPNKLKIINQANGGISNARNNGLKEAKGDYITFVDSDDFVDRDMCRKMLEKAQEEASDIVICDVYYYWGEGNSKNYIMPGLTNKFKVDDIHNRALLSSLGVWNKIYSKKFFDSANILFCEGTLYEDIEVITYLLAKAKKISYINEACLFYRQRENSIMTTRNDRCKEIFNVLVSTYDRFETNGLLSEYHDEIEYLFIENLLLYGQYRFLVLDDYKELIVKSLDTMKKYFPNYLNNKYYKQLSKKDKIFVKYNNKYTVSFFRKYLLRGVQ